MIRISGRLQLPNRNQILLVVRKVGVLGGVVKVFNALLLQEFFAILAELSPAQDQCWYGRGVKSWLCWTVYNVGNGLDDVSTYELVVLISTQD
jgi:hypothetical protein